VIEVHPRETVILATDFSAMVAWFRDVLGFKITKLYEEEFHYCNLETSTGIKIGIATAAEMGVTPVDRGKNTVVLQFQVANVKDFLTHVAKNGGSVSFGPTFDKNDSFWYGGFADPEGNPCWVVDENCP